MSRVAKGRKKKAAAQDEDSPDANTSTEEENNECKLAQLVMTIFSRLQQSLEA